MKTDIKQKFFSEIIGGKLNPEVSKRIGTCLRHFEGKAVEITIGKKKTARSLQQNSYYWLLVGILSDELGYTKDEVHDLVKYKFLRDKVIIGDSEEVITKSTSKLNTSDFCSFINQLQIWAAGLGIILPDANTQMDLKLNNT